MSTLPFCENEPAGGDGLIDPTLFVIEAGSVSTAISQIGFAGDWLNRIGDDLLTAMDDISASWWRLPASYKAPEASSVYLMMNPAHDDAGVARATVQAAAILLEDFSAAVALQREPLRELGERAAQFRQDVVDGVWVHKSDAAAATFRDTASTLLPWEWDEQVLVPWYEDGDAVARNNALLEEHAVIAAAINAAAVECANGIAQLVGTLPADYVAPEAIPEWALASGEAPMPWGYPREEERNWAESLGHAIWWAGNDFGTSIAALTGYDTVEDQRSGEFFKQTWAGVGNFLLSGAMVAATLPFLWQGEEALTDTWGGVGDWLWDRAEVVTAGIGGAAAIDTSTVGSAMFTEWHQDSIAAGGYTAINIGSFFAGFGAFSAGRAAAQAARVGAMSNRWARIATAAGRIADFAIAGGDQFVGGGIKVITTLRNAIRGGDFDDIDINPAQIKTGVDAAQSAPFSDDLLPGRPAVETGTPQPRPDVVDDVHSDHDPAGSDAPGSPDPDPHGAPREDSGGGDTGSEDPGGGNRPQSDGEEPAWRSPEDPTLTLTAAEKAAIDEYMADSRAAEPAITQALEDLVEQYPDARLEGLDHRLKENDSLYRKVATMVYDADAGASLADMLDEFNDSIRYTFVVDDDLYGSVVPQLLADVRGPAWSLKSFSNRWGGSGYVGINSTWADAATGQRFELQFHTPASFEAKMVTHELYDQARLPSTLPRVAEALELEQDLVFEQVTMPTGADLIGRDRDGGQP